MATLFYGHSPGFVYIPGRVTLRGGSPYALRKVTLLGIHSTELEYIYIYIYKLKFVSIYIKFNVIYASAIQAIIENEFSLSNKFIQRLFLSELLTCGTSFLAPDLGVNKTLLAISSALSTRVVSWVYLISSIRRLTLLTVY